MTLTLTVPGTLSNLGPGFDVVGLAVDLTNRFSFVADGARGRFWDGGVAVQGADHLVARTIEAAEHAFGVDMPHGLRLGQDERVPRGRGLGSSATARVAGVLAWHHFTGSELGLDPLLDLLVRLEGHPDNAVAAMLGGATVATRDDAGALHVLPVRPHPSVRVVVCIPEHEVHTEDARAVLPDTWPRPDVVVDLGALPFLLSGLRTANADHIGVGMRDRLHEPYRAPLVGPVHEARRAALEAGAAGVCISGSGSTMAALVADPEVVSSAVVEAMESAFRVAGRPARAQAVAAQAIGAWEDYRTATGA